MKPAESTPRRRFTSWLAGCACAVLALSPAGAADKKAPGKALNGFSKAVQRQNKEDRPYGEKLILGGCRGTMKDMARKNPPNIAQGALPKPTIEIDARSLNYKEHITRPSKRFAVRPDAPYTLVCEVKGEGDGYASAGVRWDAPQAPPGLVDKDRFATVFRVPAKWTVKSFTFTSDPDKKSANLQILLKAYGRSKVAFRKVRVVEGWYRGLKHRFKRPFRAGARSW